MPPTTRTVRTRMTLVLLVLAALVACLPGMTVATGPADPPPLTLRRPDGDDDDSDDDSDGADDQDDDDSADRDGDGDDDDSDDDSDDDDSDDDDADSQTVDDLPDWAQLIVKNARRAERQAKRDLRNAKKGEKPKPKAKPKPKKPDDDSDDATSNEPDAGTLKLRQVNLRAALEKKGYTAQRAKAVARLLDNVEYDDRDEPTDLDDVLEDAIEEYGEEIAGKGETPDPKKKRRRTATGARDGRGREKGPRLTAEEMEMAKRFGMTAEEYAAHKSTSPPEPKKKKQD